MNEGSNLRSSVNSICIYSIDPITHSGRRVQLSQIQRHILEIQMVLPIGLCGVNWQSGHPSLHPCILEMYLPRLQTVVRMFESNSFNNY